MEIKDDQVVSWHLKAQEDLPAEQLKSSNPPGLSLIDRLQVPL